MLTTLELMALIVAVVAIVKILFLITKPAKWIEFVERIYSKPSIIMVVALILGYWALQALLDAGITIVEIFAVMLFLVFLMTLSIAVYPKEIIPIGKKMLRDKSLIKKGWLAILVWFLLSIWVIKEILF